MIEVDKTDVVAKTLGFDKADFVALIVAMHQINQETQQGLTLTQVYNKAIDTAMAVQRQACACMYCTSAVVWAEELSSTAPESLPFQVVTSQLSALRVVESWVSAGIYKGIKS
jgi:hypothetical protein